MDQNSEDDRERYRIIPKLPFGGTMPNLTWGEWLKIIVPWMCFWRFKYFLSDLLVLIIAWIFPSWIVFRGMHSGGYSLAVMIFSQYLLAHSFVFFFAGALQARCERKDHSWLPLSILVIPLFFWMTVGFVFVCLAR